MYLTDVFGHKLINHQVRSPTVDPAVLSADRFSSSLQLLADDFARNGFRVIVPDLFQEPCPPNCFDPGVTFDLGAWFGRNGIDFSEPRVRTVLAALREQGVTRIAVTGYCYGARSGFNLAFEKAIDVLAVSHPSLLKVPEDIQVRVHSLPSYVIPYRRTDRRDDRIQKYKDTAVAPLLINSCTVDHMFPLEVQPKADEILGDGKFAPGYKRPYWEGCTHGFAVRGDLVSGRLPQFRFARLRSRTERPQGEGREGGCVQGGRRMVQGASVGACGCEPLCSMTREAKLVIYHCRTCGVMADESMKTLLKTVKNRPK